MMHLPNDNRYVTLEECNRLIDKAIDKHNKTASLISATLGGILLFFYAHGLLKVIDNLNLTGT